jgi:hypothetical protein
MSWALSLFKWEEWKTMKRRGFLQKLGLGLLAAPFVARMEVVEAAEVPDPEYAEGLLGRLQKAQAEYNAVGTSKAQYFECTRATRDALMAELEPGLGAPRKRGGYQVLEVDGMRWVAPYVPAPGEVAVMPAYGVFVVGSDAFTAMLRSYSQVVTRTYPQKPVRGVITGITAE